MINDKPLGPAPKARVDERSREGVTNNHTDDCDEHIHSASTQATLKRDVGFATALVKVGRSLRTLGLSHTVSKCLFQLKEVCYDWRNGTDTWGVVSLAHLDLNNLEQDHAVHYEPTPLPVIEEVLETLRQFGVAFREFEFVDLGSGKGRMLLRAARFPFQKVIGVEISRALHSVALRNVSTAKKRHTQLAPIECIRADASQFTIPATNAVIYLYHPFDRDILTRVLENIRTAQRVQNSRIYLIYVYPSLSNVIASKAFLTKVAEQRTGAGMRQYEAGVTVAPPFEIWTNLRPGSTPALAT